jgi:hypothetical protein
MVVKPNLLFNTIDNTMRFHGNTMTTPSTLIVLSDPTSSDYVESTSLDGVDITSSIVLIQHHQLTP